MRGPLILSMLLSVVACAKSSSAVSEGECVVHDDCWDSQVVQDLGRCGGHVACIEGVCEAWCPTPCEITDPDVNPCTEPGWLCEPFYSPDKLRCTPTEIPCDTAADCPKYRPLNEGSWTCTEGTCRFPGYEYLYPDPT